MKSTNYINYTTTICNEQISVKSIACMPLAADGRHADFYQCFDEACDWPRNWPGWRWQQTCDELTGECPEHRGVGGEGGGEGGGR